MNVPIPPGLQPRPDPRAPRLDDLVAAVNRVLELPDPVFGAHGVGDEILVLQRQINRLHSTLLDRVAAFDTMDGAHEVAGATTSSWLRHRAGHAAGASSDLVRTARSLRELPRAHQALKSGELTLQHTRTLSRTVHHAADHVTGNDRASVAHEVERVMVSVARGVDAGSLVGFAKRVQHIADPDGTLADANQVHNRRWFTAATSLDGMVNLEGQLDPESGATLLTVLATDATPTGPDDNRSAGQRRADALTEMCRQALDRATAPATAGVHPHLLVTTTLAGLQAHAAALSSTPASLDWAGSIPNETTRRLACDATVSRVLVDPEGLPLDIGRATRVVPPAIRTALVVRDGGCVADCCDRPPTWTEAHHIEHWFDGGRTALANLVLLCRTHHRRVHDEGWQLARREGRWHLQPP
jgi:Domain of unknown function (DUF222)/HNH endonuclease